MEEWWRQRRLGPVPYLPPWSWLYLYPTKWREGVRYRYCSWCQAIMEQIGPEKMRGRPSACTVCDAPNRNISRPIWRAFDALPPTEEPDS